ncbi:unnamed protein product [Allacma fusca]|uniref:Uncharacterized protein n=1 Tax=Allacma fusca TaxID=39272 RepID=A0A8J2P8T7_9HEXA|nr:unnamed protein product [Allacma fusca]
MLWYTSIIFRRTDPIKAVAFAIIGVQAVLAFVVTFNDAFGVPEKISELKRNVRLSSRRLTRAEHKREIERLLWSVPEVGIKIGGFHTFQRTSTLEFLAFVTENIASLLVSYPPA